MDKLLKWGTGIVIAFLGSIVILVITTFYFAINFNPAVIYMDFGTKKNLYGVYGQLDDNKQTERASEAIDVIYYKNLGFITGYSKSTTSDRSRSGAARRWQLIGLTVGDYAMAAYQTVYETNSGIGAYILKNVHDKKKETDIYVGYIIANDSNGVLTKCPYIASFKEISISEVESDYPFVKEGCETITFPSLSESKQETKAEK